jgi:hypothetical protein
MVTWALWNEFSKMQHVTLEFQSIYEPLVEISPDFVLFHACFGELEFGRLAELRKRAKYKTMSFMELPLSKEYVDYCFIYLPQTTFQHCEEISLPCLSSALNEHISTKVPGSILLDHMWPPYHRTQKEWSQYLYEWLSSYRKHAKCSISQLRRGGCESIEKFPPWVTPIPEKPYTEYLDATAHFETYILTHPGSYEHSVIDMAYRGTRVLVPVMHGQPFIPKSTIERLNLQTFTSRLDLLALLRAPTQVKHNRQSFTDAAEIALRIDNYCQKTLEA